MNLFSQKFKLQCLQDMIEISFLYSNELLILLNVYLKVCLYNLIENKFE